MNSTLDYFTKKFNVDIGRPSPISVYYSRYRLIEDFRELDFKNGAEIGTERGIYAQMVLSGNPQLKLYCVDNWSADTYYHENTSKAVMEALYEESKQRLSKYNCNIMKMTSMEAVRKFQPDSLDFVFIDGNHNFEFVMNDITNWSKIVRPGGIVYGHDYWNNNDVCRAVESYMEVTKIKPWFVLHRGGKMLNSWMFVRDEKDLINKYK